MSTTIPIPAEVKLCSYWDLEDLDEGHTLS